MPMPPEPPVTKAAFDAFDIPAPFGERDAPALPVLAPLCAPYQHDVFRFARSGSRQTETLRKSPI
ncbi:protein of unknown function [Paraburkholderia kururiensis]